MWQLHSELGEERVISSKNARRCRYKEMGVSERKEDFEDWLLLYAKSSCLDNE